MKASIQLLANIGLTSIAVRIQALGHRFIAGVTSIGYRVISPRDDEQWSGMVCFVSPIHDHAQICATLRKEHRTEILVREKRLRFAPHFYNTFEQVDRLIENLPRH